MKGFILSAPRGRGVYKQLFRYVLICALETFVSFSSSAVTLAWTPSSDPNVVGYKLYYRANDYSEPRVTINAGQSTQITVPTLSPGQSYSFYVTAYTSKNIESDPSNPVTYQVPGIHAEADNLTRLPGNTIAISPALLLANDRANGGGPLGIARLTSSGNSKVAVVYAGGIIQYLPRQDMTESDWFTYVVTNSAYAATGRVNITMGLTPTTGGAGTTGTHRPQPPDLRLVPTDAGAQIRFANATPGQDYRVQTTTLIKVLPDWVDIGVVTAGSDGTAVFTDANVEAESAKFYRAVSREAL